MEPISFIAFILALIFALTVHEFAHAYVADHLGDPTPRLQGRMTLNPLAHLDPLGTLCFVLFHIGWAKPVQFDPFNLRHPRRDAALISLAGPASNLILATMSALLFRINIPQLLVHELLSNLVIYNVVLAVFNLIPIHPLDGFKVVGGWLSPRQAKEWYSLEKYGVILLLLFILPIFGPAPVSMIVIPVVKFLVNLLVPGLLGGLI